MTLVELQILQRVLKRDYSLQEKLNRLNINDYIAATNIVEREIQLKEMDPRKDKSKDK